MKPIAASINDTHLKDENIETNKSIFTQFIEYCVNHDIKHCFHFGDIFNSRKAMPLHIAKVFEEILDMFQEVNLTLVACKGNHDCQNYEGEDSYLDLFKYHPAFKVIRDNGFVRISDNINFHLIPFFKESTTYKKYLDRAAIEEGKLNYLGTHVAIDGAMNNDGSHVIDILPTHLFDKFDKVIVAHYHNEYHVNNKIWYCGSGFQHNYGEDSNKGMVVYYDSGDIEKVKLNFPEYIKYTVSINDISESELIALSKEKESGNNIRIELTGESEKLKSFDRTILTDIGIDTVLKPNEAIISISETQSVTHDKKSIRNGFLEFCEENKVTENEYELSKIDMI